VAWTGSDDDFQGFVDRYDLSFPSISDDPGDVFARFEIPYQPAVVVIAPDGTVETIYGAADEALLDTVIEGALA
jgi:peroxiredoxin